ncbi:GAF and ANTAR domain-containing protein [Streptomyces sp. MMG1121]|uniref:GAF and ANTAR domain-containing protein n=1 Tax=Streptomyces sp. MMG1121 TaxID=1415544 RepID=UPI0006C5DE13|nr:GAF and ANTAR domain-containing protein [Streptomyces sp. MMG1121]KOV67462.1 antitermination regulator [Streptomyces sp. MMG1121]
MALLARDLLAQESLDATLDRISTTAVELVEGCDEAGILDLRKGEVETLSACGDHVQESDRLQGRLGEGPCFDAARDTSGGRVYRIPDLTSPDGRWPHFSPAARSLGYGSMMGFLLYTRNDDFGALNLYAYGPGAFTAVSETAGWLFASHAAVALAGARTQEQLEHALETRHAIGEAMGILMERHGLSEPDAFGVLRRISQNHNVKLRDVARRIGGGASGADDSVPEEAPEG